MGREKLTGDFNKNLTTEYQSVVRHNLQISAVAGPEFVSALDELTKHLAPELNHARLVVPQVSLLGGETTSDVRSVPTTPESWGAIEADQSLEQEQLERYQERLGPTNQLGWADVGEALRPRLEQTQEPVPDLLTALGR